MNNWSPSLPQSGYTCPRCGRWRDYYGHICYPATPPWPGYDFNLNQITWPFPATTASVKFVTIPLCPDRLTLEDIGAADFLRGRAIRAVFWLLDRLWKPPPP